MYIEFTKKKVFEQLTLAVDILLTAVLPVKKYRFLNATQHGGELRWNAPKA